jgi:aminomethyltransferase
MTNKTPLYSEHIALGATMVDFAGWDMPIHYGSQIQEHHQVRQEAGMFDVSHMTVVDLHGADTRKFLRYLLANDVERLQSSGQALYSCILNEDGGVVDDLIVYYLDGDRFRMVTNAATREKDLAWLQQHRGGFEVNITERPELGIIAVQGMKARHYVLSLLDPSLREAAQPLARFNACWEGDPFVACTGYTGEDGFELILPRAHCIRFWRALRQAGVLPVGLGARDTLRLEAGMNLYGADMDETTTPLESGLAWTVAWEPQARKFVGRKALGSQRERGLTRLQVGLVLLEKGVLRAHQPVLVEGLGTGIITSGGFSPTLGQAIALARVPADTGREVEVEIRGKRLKAAVVKPPFVRNGRSCLTEHAH